MHYNYKDFLRMKHFLMHTKVKKRKKKNFIVFFNRSTTIGPYMVRKSLYIYNGKSWRKIFITKFMVGRKIGEFVWNRKFSLRKKKLKKKKK